MSKLILCAFADEASSSVSGQIEALKRNGIGYIEPRGLDGKSIADISTDEAKQYAEMFRDGGIKVWSVGSPIGKVNIADDFGLELDRFKRCIDTGVIMGAECLRLFSFYGTEGKAEYKDEVCLRLSRFVEAAEGSGITLCHENEKGIYGDIALRCLELAQNVPGLKLVFDAANFIQSKQPSIEGWNMLKPYVKYCHIKDAAENGHIVPPGYGVTEIEKYLADFERMGGGVLTVEPHLSGFVGLDKLAQDDERKRIGSFSFASNSESFDFAVNSLKKFL